MTTVTQKDQITIPKSFRNSLGIGKLTKVRIKQGKDHVKIYPAGPDILDLAGRYHAPKGMTALKARVNMETNYRRV
jgi:AbrB family looped-hinge helix DNA binding protein